ncbi:uncharacterized protein MAM_07789 [Metarhizium album ARSEF 1941]|uniref:Uncharacterized protein n=1 Tax=Metarhizium album (strain ARSEF 1941) TaxID=1081103 RepID=A0A0B2WMX1_METAS|nr:uncharacterized protein MAM_07789 [Metarhizium album ARSEF 1941]KHN94360.1 hypothetical protein MAM_07789 [Metarhizium album ARSEF 1941]
MRFLVCLAAALPLALGAELSTVVQNLHPSKRAPRAGQSTCDGELILHLDFRKDAPAFELSARLRRDSPIPQETTFWSGPGVSITLNMGRPGKLKGKLKLVLVKPQHHNVPDNLQTMQIPVQSIYMTCSDGNNFYRLKVLGQTTLKPGKLVRSSQNRYYELETIDIARVPLEQSRCTDVQRVTGTLSISDKWWAGTSNEVHIRVGNQDVLVAKGFSRDNKLPFEVKDLDRTTLKDLSRILVLLRGDSDDAALIEGITTPSLSLYLLLQ